MTPRELMIALSRADPEERKRIIASITPHDLLMLDADFESWAQDGQIQPLGEGWRVWLMMAGRGFGKTRAGAEWIHKLGCGRKPLRIALVGSSIAEARSIMVEGVSGILSVAGRNLRMLWTQQDGWGTSRDGLVKIEIADQHVWDPEIRAVGQLSSGFQTILPPTASFVTTLRLTF